MAADTRDEISVVLVDDDNFQLKILNHHLTESGIDNVVVCTNGLEAIDQINIRKIYSSLILLDLNMPIMDGVTFLSLLKKTDFNGAIILVSGEDLRILESTVKLASSYDISVIGHLKKPVAKEQLEYLIERFKTSSYKKKAVNVKREYDPERLSYAILKGEISNEYQPKVDMRSGHFFGIEALVRWKHPDDGLIYPDEFIPLAEENDLIDSLFHSALKSSLHDYKALKDAGLPMGSVAVNVSVENLTSIEIISRVKNELDIVGVDPQELTLEITESTLIREFSLVLGILTSLRLQQIGLSIDDFGTGHSSMAQLRDMPFNELKLDGSFVHKASEDNTLRSIFNASLKLAQDLRLTTVAEGIENIDDWDFAAEAGCDFAQGNFISQPMPAQRLSQWNKAWLKMYESKLKR